MSLLRNTVLVGGGTGFIGKHVCRILRNKNFTTKIISRMPGPNHMTWNDLEAKGLPNGTIAVINLAGQNVMDPTKRWTPGFKQNVWNSRIRTTTALTQAIINADKKPKSYVTISGVGIYKPSFTEEYAEDYKGVAYDYFSKLCLEWEKVAKLPGNLIECRQVTIRTGVVLGKDGGMIKQLYLPFFLGLGGPIGSGKQYLPWIHVTDLARLITFAVEKDGLRGILNGVAPQPITNKEFAQSFAQALRRPAIIPLPVSLVNMIFDKERAIMVTEGQKVLPKRTQAMGFSYLFPDIKSACAELVS